MTDMTKPYDGGPAFPMAPPQWDGNGNSHWGIPGMTMRDWFAGQALSGMIASNQWHIGSAHGSAANIVADHAYEMADAMLDARGAK